jgi:pyridoxine 4-dehydrogenase
VEKNQTVKQRKFGKTGVTVGAIGLGAMPLSLDERPPEEQAIAVIHRALDLGVTLIDTADSYCIDERDKHHNERLIAKAFGAYPKDTSPNPPRTGKAGCFGSSRGENPDSPPRTPHRGNISAGCGDVTDRESIIVATKGGLMRPKGDWIVNGDPEHLKKTIRESFEALGEERPIPLWQLHAPDSRFPIEESLQPVREAVDAGLIRFVGLSNVSVKEIERARKVIEVVSIQNQFSPWDREPERNGVLKYCEKEGLTFLPWSPLGGSHRVRRLGEIATLTELAKEKGISPQRLVLAWMLAKWPCIIPIPGASRIQSIEDSVGAADVVLSAEEIRRLDQIIA